MLSSQCLALMALAAAVHTTAGFQLGSDDRVMWEDDCDYYGDDTYSVVAIPDVCGDLCADDSSCTHWSWNNYDGGTCWLKSGTSATKSGYDGGGCGYVLGRFGTTSSGKTGLTTTETTTQSEADTDQTSQTDQTDQTEQTSQSTSYDNGLTSDETAAMLASINSYRSDNGLSALTIDSRLMAAAMVHSEDQATQCTMTHDGSDGSEAWDRMEAQGYDWTVAAENVAAGQTSVSAVMTSWWNSAGHRANILKDDVSNVGFALATNSDCSNYATYWTQDFGEEG